MKKARNRSATALLSVLVLTLLSWACVQEVRRMEINDLQANLDNIDIVIIDTRLDTDWTASEGKIPGSLREDPVEVNAWSKKYDPNKTIVTYCA